MSQVKGIHKDRTDTETMRVQFTIDTYGIVDIDLWVNLEYCAVNPSDVLNSPLDEIMDALIFIKQGWPTASITLYGEPGEDRWHIRRMLLRPGYLKVVVKSYNDFEDRCSGPDQCLEFIVQRDYFIECFLAEFDKIALKVKSPEYAEGGYAFPWDGWRELRRLCKKTNE